MTNCLFCNKKLTKYQIKYLDVDYNYSCNCTYRLYLTLNKNDRVYWDVRLNDLTIMLSSSKKENKTCLIDIFNNKKLLVIDNFIPLPNNISEFNELLDKLYKLQLY